MPRTKPDETIIHRHELGGFERERLDQFLTAASFNQVANPVVKLLSDNTAMLTLLVLVAYVFPNWRKDPATGDDMSDEELLWVADDQKKGEDYLETQNLVGMAAGAAGGVALAGAVATGPVGWLGLTVAALTGATAGGLVVEGAEEVASDAQRAKIYAKRQWSQIKLFYDLGWGEIHGDRTRVD